MECELRRYDVCPNGEIKQLFTWETIFNYLLVFRILDVSHKMIVFFRLPYVIMAKGVFGMQGSHATSTTYVVWFVETYMLGSKK